jgi:DNA-binding NarL/FixJ family response regulator
MACKILLVGNHSVLRIGISFILKLVIEDLTISIAENFKDTKEKLETQVFDLIMVDINLPNAKNARMAKDIRALQANAKILMFSAYFDLTYLRRHLNSGINGYLSLANSNKVIADAVMAVMETGRYTPIEIANEVLDRKLNNVSVNPITLLSKRENEIARLLVSGDGNLEIANKLQIKMNTVSTYKNRAFAKLNITNIVELIAAFREY